MPHNNTRKGRPGISDDQNEKHIFYLRYDAHYAIGDPKSRAVPGGPRVLESEEWKFFHQNAGAARGGPSLIAGYARKSQQSFGAIWGSAELEGGGRIYQPHPRFPEAYAPTLSMIQGAVLVYQLKSIDYLKRQVNFIEKVPQDIVDQVTHIAQLTTQ